MAPTLAFDLKCAYDEAAAGGDPLCTRKLMTSPLWDMYMCNCPESHTCSAFKVVQSKARNLALRLMIARIATIQVHTCIRLQG